MDVWENFWQLPSPSVLKSQNDFYDHLKRSNHLKNAIYEPDDLTKQAAGRTQRIENVSFEKVSFSKTSIRGVIFRSCEFINCQLIATQLKDCEFHDCRFIRTNTHKISLSNTYLDPLSFKKCLDRRKHQNIGVHLFQTLMNNSRDAEQIEFERDAQFLFLRWKRYQDGYEFKKSWSKAAKFSDYFAVSQKGFRVLQRLFWEKLFGSGIRIRYYLVTVLSTIIVASILNFQFRHEFGLEINEEIISSWPEAVYFTTISLTTLGYGDITPTTELGRWIASFQSIVGFSLFALLASMLFRKVAP